MLQFVGRDSQGMPNHGPSMDFVTSKGKNYRIQVQILTPGQGQRIIEFGLVNGRTLLNVTYTPRDGVVLSDELLIDIGFEALKGAADLVELGSVEFFEMYATQRDIPLREVLNSQISNLIRDGRRVRVIMDNGVYYEGCIVSSEDNRIRFFDDKGNMFIIDSQRVKEVQLL